MVKAQVKVAKARATRKTTSQTTNSTSPRLINKVVKVNEKSEAQKQFEKLFRVYKTKVQYKTYMNQTVNQARYAKAIAELGLDKTANAQINKIKKSGYEIAEWSYVLVKLQMQHQGIDGLPCIDMKTYSQWKKEGMRVRQGEKSTVHGIMYKEMESGFNKPTRYSLFHVSQVEPIS